MLIAFNKPFGVICQFSPSGDRQTLKNYVDLPEVYPAGRLDTDSEGLLMLTDDGILQARITDPANKLIKTYWAQVEGTPGEAALATMRKGLNLGDFVTKPARVSLIPVPPDLWPRNPPVRYRASIPTTWLEIAISEGKNRQVRRMTAKIGYPTLRLVRVSVGPWSLGSLPSGEYREANPAELPKSALRRTKVAKNP